jgi:hypothetical protein
MKADDFDKKFDDGEDVTAFLDMKTAKRSDMVTKRVNVDFPEWMIAGLNQEAERLGITRQALIKFWISTHLTDAKRLQDND